VIWKCTRKETPLHRVTVGNIQTDQVRSFSYLGTTVNGNNTLEEEIRERIVKEIKHSIQTELFLKATCPEIQIKVILVSN
jgi:hypothetical protein